MAGELMVGRLSRWLRVLGAGNLVVATLWAGAGWHEFRDIGTKSLMLVFSEGMAAQVQSPPEAESSSAFPNTPPPPAHPLGILSFSSPPAQPRTAPRGPQRPSRVAQRPPRPRSAAQRPVLRPELAEPTRQVWGALTAALIGVIATCGLSEVMDVRGRRMMRVAVWLAGLACIGVFLLARHTVFATQRDWIGVVLSLSQSQQVWCGFIGIAVLVMAILGTFALRAGRRPATWNGVAIAAVFGGTLLTLSALAVLINFAGFPPLPSWIYGAVALIQSSWAWVLLLAAPRLTAASHAPGVDVPTTAGAPAV